MLRRTEPLAESSRRRGVRLIANPENRGFAAAVNQGFADTESPYILLLNPGCRDPD